MYHASNLLNTRMYIYTRVYIANYSWLEPHSCIVASHLASTQEVCYIHACGFAMHTHVFNKSLKWYTQVELNLWTISAVCMYVHMRVRVCIIEYGSTVVHRTLYVGSQLKQNGHPYKAMAMTVSKSQQ